jgi:hypothetical protein
MEQIALYVVIAVLLAVVVAQGVWRPRVVTERVIETVQAPPVVAERVVEKEAPRTLRVGRPVTIRLVDAKGNEQGQVQVPEASRRPSFMRGLDVYQAASRNADGTWNYRHVGRERRPN